MQLDQHPRPGDSAEPDIDRTSDRPTTQVRAGRERPVVRPRRRDRAAARRQLADRDRVLRRQPHRARRRRDHARRPVAEGAAVRADRTGRDRHRPRVRVGRARRRGRHLRRARAPREPARRAGSARPSGSTSRASPGCAACGRCRRRPKRRACTAAATRKARDASAIAHHYDVSNDFYRMVLGPSMTYSCAVWPTADAGARDRAGHEVRARLPQARARAGHAAARRRLRVGRHGRSTPPGTTACTRSASRSRSRKPSGRGARCATPGSTTGSRSASRTTATSTTDRSTRSARSACSSTSARPSSTSTSARCSAWCGRAAGCSTTGSRGPAPARRAAAIRAPRLHRPLRVPRRRAARGRQRRVAHPEGRVRGAPRRGPPRALRAHAACVGAQPRSRRGRERSPRSAPGAPACGASTWRRRPSASKTGRIADPPGARGARRAGRERLAAASRLRAEQPRTIAPTRLAGHLKRPSPNNHGPRR